MSAGVVAGSAHRALAEAVATALGAAPVSCELERFPDGELRGALTARGEPDVRVMTAVPM
jgi:ribose-phosphate pyrophosphokinase